MKTETEIRKRIAQHQSYIQYYQEKANTPPPGVNPTTHYQECMKLVAKEQAIINELKLILEEQYETT